MMKQLLQRLDTGATTLVDAPVPAPSGAQILVETRATLVSAGTERMLVEFGRSTLLAKARQQPDKVRQVLDKARTDGLGPTLEAVRAKLDAPLPLGYCNAGVIVQTGSRATGYRPGDRVVTNGPHAEYVRVPLTLAARIPDGVSYESASFTPLAAIGLQGVRLASPTLGETVVVFGLGLIGLLTVQLLRANGCRVIGIDRSASRLALAERLGAVSIDASHKDPTENVLALTAGIGADAVLLTLAAESDEPVHQAAAMSRKRGRLVLVGVTGLRLARDDFYKKELSFTVSCSYGPGRHDPAYEEGAQDYPVGFVRWTEQRNFEAVLALMAEGRLDPQPLITHRFDFEETPKAYDLIASATPSLGVVLRYSDRGGVAPMPSSRVLDRTTNAPTRKTGTAGTVGLIGAGNFATRTILPLLKAAGVRLRTIAANSGASSAVAGEKFGFERVTTDAEVVFSDPEIDAIFVLTRHDTHASLVVRALEAGKHVFVEKPLALTEEELRRVEASARSAGRIVMVGFNRRFAPLTAECRKLLAGRAGPVSVVATVNAGKIPREHWTQDPSVGGGRIVGEASHWIDLARALVGAPIAAVQVTAARDQEHRFIDDIAHVAIEFVDGSTAVVHYLASGARSFPKERIECFFDGKTIAVDNWRRLRRFGIKSPFFERPRRMDKGHAAELAEFASAIRGEASSPIQLEELVEVSRWSIRAAAMARGDAVASGGF